jgi:hypothetical protein
MTPAANWQTLDLLFLPTFSTLRFATAVVPAVTAAIKSLCYYTQRKTANPAFARLAV